MYIEIRHKTGWTACLTWSKERALHWINSFDANLYTDKTLKASDFEIVEAPKLKKGDN